MAKRIDARKPKSERVVFVLGAGASKACGGPMTREILPWAFTTPAPTRAKPDRRVPLLAVPNNYKELDRFLVQCFGVPAKLSDRRVSDYPQFPLLLSLIDTAIDRDHTFGGAWGPDRLRQVRWQAGAVMFQAIGTLLRRLPEWKANLHQRAMRWAMARGGGEMPSVISLNYDLLADYGLIDADLGGLPEYRCDIATPAYRDAAKAGALLKLHGSMNWLYCPACHRLEVGVSQKGNTYKAALGLFRGAQPETMANLDSAYGSRDLCCRVCSCGYQPVMITPTALKDYRNPHIARVWYEAARELQQATRVVFIGYSLPWDDLEVIYLLKRGMAKLRPEQITVVASEHAEKKIENDESGQRYMAVFGRGVDWQPLGFERWLESVEGAPTPRTSRPRTRKGRKAARPRASRPRR